MTARMRAPDHGLAIVERVKKVRSCGTEPRNWCWRIPEAPNGHITNTVGLDLQSSINDVVYATEREHSVILLDDRRQISRPCFQCISDWSRSFSVSAMARRATRLIFRLADVRRLRRRRC